MMTNQWDTSTRRLEPSATYSNHLFTKNYKLLGSGLINDKSPYLLAMSTAYPLPSNVSPTTVKNTVSLLRIVALALISGAAIASRLFAVVNFESIIHELYVFNFYKCSTELD